MSRKLTLRYVHCNRGDLFHIPRCSSPSIEFSRYSELSCGSSDVFARTHGHCAVQKHPHPLLFCLINSDQSRSHKSYRIERIILLSVSSLNDLPGKQSEPPQMIRGQGFKCSFVRLVAARDKRLVIYCDGIQTSERGSGLCRTTDEHKSSEMDKDTILVFGH